MGRTELLADRMLRERGISSPPVPVEQIAVSEGAELSFEPFQGAISGMLFRDEHRSIIGVNSVHPNTRQRFTIAHEIGHLVMHRGKPLIVDKSVLMRVNLRQTNSSKTGDKEEMEANSFAAELLMPRSMVLHEVARRLVRQPSLAEARLAQTLAKAFGVSVLAMEYRLINLGIRLPL